jgi:predicted 2-oxoglutarate/Fe(II)-dependent dioxygenase YbiX
VGVLDHTHKIRRDHYLAEGEFQRRVMHHIFHRVRPEIKRAFQFDATRFEDFRVVCYDAERGGYFRPHRDNTTDGTAHRAFAMTLNLNSGEYEGGGLRFPEYGPRVYRPGTGEAVIFSCSLFHEATDVTAGRRFALLSFLYGEREAQLREEIARRTGAEYRARR